LYGLYEAIKTERNLTRLLVVEGYMDVVMLSQYDIHCAVATLGTATSSEHLKRLLRISQEIIFCFDGDEAGRKAAWRALEVTLPLMKDGYQIRFLFLPQSEDPDSLVKKEGTEKFINLLENAIPLSEFLFNHLTAQVNLNLMDGKARLAKLIMPLIQKIPPSIYQHMLFEKLAGIINIDANKLEAFINPSSTPKKKSSPKPSLVRITPMRLAISLLLQNPNLVPLITIDLENFNLPGASLFKELVSHISQYPTLSTGAILENWRDRKEYSLLLNLAAIEHPFPNSGIFIEFQEVLKRLQQFQKDDLVNKLMLKAKQEGLSDSERHTLQKLLASPASDKGE
jgi:DNA primase